MIGPPRGGTTLMLDALGLNPRVLALGAELHRFHHDLAKFPHRHGEDDHFRLTARDATPELVAEYHDAVDRALAAANKSQLVVKISTLSQQVDYVLAIFPDARFIQCVRDGRDTTCSMEDLRLTLQAEQDHPRLLGPAPDPLSLWAAQTFEHPHLRAGCAWYYHVTRSFLDLRFAGADKVLRLRYEDLVAEPRERLEEVMRFVGLPFDPAQNAAVTATTDMPGAPGSLGFSHSQAQGPRRNRYLRDLAPELRILLAPLLAGPMRMLGYACDPMPEFPDIQAAASAIGIDLDVWVGRLSAETAWLEKQIRAFDPVKVLREADLPSDEAKPLLIDGATYGCHADTRDGNGAVTHAWVRKQNRSYAFADPSGLWPVIARNLNGNLTLSELVGPDALEAAKQLCGRLHGLGFVGYL
ncbi:MAG TPA: sulfotransferase [Myxococcota bacterium]|nr:sulfotransferase [Myxococcota bacterium]